MNDESRALSQNHHYDISDDVDNSPAQEADNASSSTLIEAPSKDAPPIPDYLQDIYWWACLHPKSFLFFEHEWVVNLILCLLFLVYLVATSQSLRPASIDAFPQILFWANLALFLFNLVPAFPMDGGRILRSLLAIFVPYNTATMIAGNLGRVLAILFIVVGLYRGEFPFVLIGFFVFFAATAEIEFTRDATDSDRLD